MRYVFKFGGSSLSSAHKIKEVANFIKQTLQRKNLELIIVVSAMGKTTNNLISFAEKLYNNPNCSEFSSLITLGENVSANALSLALQGINIPSIALNANDIKIHSKGYAQHSIITHIDTNIIESYLQQRKVVIITGYQGVDSNGNILTLGRGGSDTTATALGHALNANVKIFTDVCGYFTTDPNIYNKAKKLSSINIYSALELANCGAKVLDHRCLEIANINKINLSVNQSLTHNGTKISYLPLETYKLDGISVKNKLLFVKNTNKNAKIIQNLIKITKLNLYLFESHANSASFVCDIVNTKNLLKKELNKLNKIYVKNCSLITIAGSGLNTYLTFIQKVQTIIKSNKIKVYSLILTPTNLKIALPEKQCTSLTEILLNEFNLLNKEK